MQSKKSVDVKTFTLAGLSLYQGQPVKTALKGAKYLKYLTELCTLKYLFTATPCNSIHEVHKTVMSYVTTVG